MVKSLTGELSSYMSMVQRVHHTVKKSFLENGKLNRFIVARIYSRKHLTNMRTAGKKSKRNKRWEGSNISAMNSFEGGMVSDLHVGSSPSNTVTNALNMELITVGENQYIFQNIKGQKHVLDLPVL
jgi:tRNA A37 threonylcarbamoyltransferase TsaD